MRNKGFYTKTIIMLSVILGMLLLDIMVPESFYVNFINNTRVFKVSSLILTVSALLGTILCKYQDM